MNLLGYVRVSTDDQRRHGHSLDAQPATLRRYCELHGHLLMRVIVDEGVSGSVELGRRRGGRELIDALATGEAEGVVVTRLDRLFRDALDGLGFFANGAAVHSVADLIDTSTPAGKLNLTISLAAAQYERDMAVQRATESSRSLRAAGRAYASAPYGCVAIGVAKRQGGDGKALFRVPAIWAMRQRLVDARTKPDGSERSLRELALWARAARIRSPAGERNWGSSALRRVLDGHDSLAHLPMLPRHLAEMHNLLPEAEVSP